MDFLDVLCDTGANVNVMFNTIASKLEIVDIKPLTITVKLGDAFNMIPRGFMKNLIVQVGGYLVPVDFHIIEMSKYSHMPLNFGST